jgi:NAD(P)-dependent dehydrogenase (short-subunit alcohol dehydrogenase family)
MIIHLHEEFLLHAHCMVTGISISSIMQHAGKKKPLRPQQRQRPPGSEARMRPQPVSASASPRSTPRFQDQVVLITGGDSGIGRAVAIAFAKEGAHVAIAYLNEHADAAITAELVSAQGRTCLLLPGSLTTERHCKAIVQRTHKRFSRLDVLVNNCAMHIPQDRFEDIDREQLERTFKTNVYSCFSVTRAALRHMKEGACIINTTSVTAYRGSAQLVDYSATKAALVGFTRSLAAQLIARRIRVNAVAPGPVWTPLIASSFSPGKVAVFGSDAPMGRAAQPAEIAPAYLFLASGDANFITGQVIHPNGGEIVNG